MAVHAMRPDAWAELRARTRSKHRRSPARRGLGLLSS
eukprot:CAMPEP_0176287474 /NCGR_PEP_ID=MMETSP0121_2-20121125/53455_1 /TAXON_ID=160619 /ORGANISM="Kryptoperidinium foliaceum, Strain CCMP 1326" /LENGTH=36 /DNA_ID= /DNA_START= /DNA_END= /DNA_ORIENTATION=